MMDFYHRVFLRSLVLGLIAFPLAACSDFSGAFRQFNYPSDFNYVNGQELSSRMQQLAYELQQLDLALAAEHDERPDLQQHVVGILLDIERIGGNLEASDTRSDHPFLQDDMDTFLADVRQARVGTSLNPPRYYMAGRVSGGCVNCHRVDR